MEGNMKDNNLSLVLALMHTYNNFIKASEKNVKEYQLTLSEFGVMEMLLNKGPQPVQKIADKILVTSGTITYVINKLEEKGFVRREKCKDDKRVIYVILTDKGTMFIGNVFKEHKNFLKDIFSMLNEEEKKKTIKHLLQLNQSIKNNTSAIKTGNTNKSEE
jgi:MarR family 2-MHQ and catechol resistance regulon transcriptional repressor